MYILKDFSSMHFRSGSYWIVTVPKSGRPVLGQIALYSGSMIVMVVRGYWLAQVSMRGSFAVKPDSAQFPYDLTILERHDLVAHQAARGLDLGDLADLLADERGAERGGDGDRVHLLAALPLADEEKLVLGAAVDLLDFHVGPDGHRVELHRLGVEDFRQGDLRLAVGDLL